MRDSNHQKLISIWLQYFCPLHKLNAWIWTVDMVKILYCFSLYMTIPFVVLEIWRFYYYIINNNLCILTSKSLEIRRNFSPRQIVCTCFISYVLKLLSRTLQRDAEKKHSVEWHIWDEPRVYKIGILYIEVDIKIILFWDYDGSWYISYNIK